MHLAEHYALSCGVKIGKPESMDLFFPMLDENFITIDTSHSNDKCIYHHWQSLIKTITPILKSSGISVYQIGDPHCRSVVIGGTNNTLGAVNYNQMSFILKRSLLHISTGSLTTQMAGNLGIKNLTLLPFFARKNYNPIWGKNNLNLVSDSDSINDIKPELVAKKIAKTLGLKFDFPFTTVYTGSKHHDGAEFVESIPNNVVNLSSLGIDNITYRMDLDFNEGNLNQQLIVGKCSIVTDKPISKHLLSHFRNKITEVVYLIKENDNPDFCEQVKNLGVKLVMVSVLNDSKTRDKKINYMSIGKILNKPTLKLSDIEEIKSLDPSTLYYRSNKFTLSEGKIYPSEAAWKEDKPLQDKSQIFPIINNSLFWESVDNYQIFQK